jgi:type IV secretory pathway VirB10-like protein
MKLQLQNMANLFKNIRTRSIILLTGFILLFGFLYGVIHLAHKKEPVADTSVQLKDSPSDIESVPGGLDKSPSADYQRLQAQQNLQQVAIAEKTGTSTIPTLLDTHQFDQTQIGPLQGNSVCSPCNTGAKSTVIPLLQPSQLKSGTLIYDLQGNIIGHLGADGKLRNSDGQVMGQVGPDGLVHAKDGTVIGSAAVPAMGDGVYDAAGRLMARVARDGTVVDAQGRVIGKVGPEGLVRNLKGAVIGKTGVNRVGVDEKSSSIPGTPVYDNQGRLLATLGNDGNVRDSKGIVIGKLDSDGQVRGLQGEIIGKLGATAPGTPVYDLQGHLFGTVASDGIVRDATGKALGRLTASGRVRDGKGKLIGSIIPPVKNSAPLSNKPAQPESAVSLLPSSTNNADPELQAILDRQAEQISTQKAEQLQQQIQASMGTQAGQLFAAWASPSQQYVTGSALIGNQLGNNLLLSDQAKSEGRPPSVKAGTILYAVLLTAVNSDEPGPVLAEIVQGKLKGGRLIGSLSNQGKKVLLSFNTLNLPKLSQTIAVNTVAIDEGTARTALSSYTNSHYWLRYGTLFASAFIQGYGQSFLNSGSPYAGAVIINPTNTTPDLSPRDRVFVGLGQVGLQYSSVLRDVFNTPPTVHVFSGTPMGILFLSDLAALPTQ